MHNDLTFFTNEPEHTLYDRFKSILKSNRCFIEIYISTTEFKTLLSLVL
jgi:hypothetical protein